jgi:RNA polymerase sigma factor (sigma-70 family)
LESIPTAIQGCIDKDPKCQKALYEHYFGYCLKVVFRYIYRYETAIDIVNDGFVKVFRSFEKFEVKDKENIEMILMGWMRTIMVNTAIDHLRKNSFLPEIGSLSDSAWAIEDKSQPSDKNILYKELISQVKKLPPSYRAVFNMYVIDGFSHQEIATRLGISVGTSKSNLSKARVILQKFIKQNEQEVNYAISR